MAATRRTPLLNLNVMERLVSFLVVVSVIAVIPLVLLWTVKSLTKRESTAGRFDLPADPLRAIGNFVVSGSFVLYALLCLVIAADGIGTIKRGNETKQWKATRGFVASLETLEARSNRHGTIWCPMVSVTYEHAGELLSTSNIGFGHECFLWQSSALSFARQYRPSSDVTVYVNPVDPAEAVLFPGVGWFAYLSPVGGFGGAALGVFAALYYRLFRRSGQKAPVPPSG